MVTYKSTWRGTHYRGVFRDQRGVVRGVGTGARYCEAHDAALADMRARDYDAELGAKLRAAFAEEA